MLAHRNDECSKYPSPSILHCWTAQLAVKRLLMPPESAPGARVVVLRIQSVQSPHLRDQLCQVTEVDEAIMASHTLLVEFDG